MGIPCPSLRHLYYAILRTAFLDAFPDNLRFYKRFIDDVLASGSSPILPLTLPPGRVSRQHEYPEFKLQ
jgi:hypothetical protein